MTEKEKLMNVISDIQFVLDSSKKDLAMSKEEYMEQMNKYYGAKTFTDVSLYYPFMCGALEGYLELIQEKINKMEKTNETK